MPINEENTTHASENNTPTSKEMLLFALEPKIQRFLQMHMTGQYTQLKLAELLQVHPNTVTGWLRRADVKEAMLEAQNDVHLQVSSHLKALTLKATAKLTELIDSPIDAVALQAVKDVLDRGGHKTKNEIKVEKTVTTVEQRLKELIDSTIIDADYKELGE